MLIFLSSCLLYAENKKIPVTNQVNNSSGIKSVLRMIWGHRPEKSSIGIGSLVYHFHPRSRFIYPYVTLRLKNGFAGQAFENTWHHFSMAVCFNRVVYSNASENTHGKGFSAGYDVGILYGYCLTWFKCTSEPKPGKQTFFNSVPIMPASDIYTQYAFNRHYGMTFTWAGSIVKADFLYQF